MSAEAQKHVVVLQSNPEDTPKVRTDEEIRIIAEALDRSKKRDEFRIEVKTSVTDKHLRRAILDFQPVVVHICGHGSGPNGIVFENEATNRVQLISTTALAGTFRLAKHTDCVVLNVCSSEIQANEVAKHIPYVIGMQKPISDKAALKFAEGFYDALFAGETFPASFEWGINAIQSAGIPEDSTPSLKLREPELTQSQVLVGRYYYYKLEEHAIPLGNTGFSMQRFHAFVVWIHDRATCKDTFVEYTWLHLKSLQDRISIPYTSEWTFTEIRRQGAGRKGVAINTEADITTIRRAGLDSFSTPDRDLKDRFEEAKRCIVEQFPRADATWQENEEGQLQKIIDYHNGKSPTIYLYKKSAI